MFLLKRMTNGFTEISKCYVKRVHGLQMLSVNVGLHKKQHTSLCLEQIRGTSVVDLYIYINKYIS